MFSDSPNRVMCQGSPPQACCVSSPGPDVKPPSAVCSLDPVNGVIGGSEGNTLYNTVEGGGERLAFPGAVLLFVVGTL